MDIKYRNIQQAPPSLLFSVLAATTTELITYPLESIKVRLQMNNTQGIPKYKGIIDCARSIKLYRGIIAGLANHVPYVCLKLWIYELSKMIFTGSVEETTYPRKVSHIAFAGCLALGFVNPAEILRIRMINTQKGEQLSLLKGEGYIKNLWKGYPLNAFNLTICFSISLGITNKIKRYCKLSLDIKNDNYNQLIAASIGGLVGACVTSPVDVLKTRYMNDVSGQSLYTLFKEVFLQLQIYKGFSLYSLRMVSMILVFQMSENFYKNMI